MRMENFQGNCENAGNYYYRASRKCFLLRFHTRQAVASDISFFSRTAHTNNLFTRHSSYCVYMRLIHARVCVHKKEKKEYFWWKKKELKEKSLYNSVLRLPALRKSTHTIASLDLSWETFFISSSSYFHLMMLFSPVCLFSLSLLYILCVCCVFKTDFSSTFFVYTFFQHLCSLFLSLSFPFCLFLFSHIEKYLSFTSLCSLYICWTTYKQHWPPRFIPLHINILMAFYRLKLLYISHVFHSH